MAASMVNSVFAFLGSIAFAVWAAHIWNSRCRGCNSTGIVVDSVYNNTSVEVHHCVACGEFIAARRVKK